MNQLYKFVWLKLGGLILEELKTFVSHFVWTIVDTLEYQLK